MNRTICILGRQPALGLAELESIFGADKLQPLGPQAVLIDRDPGDVAIDQLGGSLKACKLLTYISSTELPGIIKYISDTLPKHFAYLPAGKLHIGLSFYGFGFSPSKINAAGLQIKKQLKSKDRGVRIVPNKQSELNAAQIIHNQLTGPNGMELVLIKSGKRTALAQTLAVQDIDAYAARDQKRPKRDARVGMLPPKLAQIIVNLAARGMNNRYGEGLDAVQGRDEERNEAYLNVRRVSTEGSDKAMRQALTILDPFCGTGVLLQEAILMGYNVYGTDLEPRMVEYTEINLDWLNITSVNKRVRQADATSARWEEPFDVMAAETYLGRPLSQEPKPETLAEIVRDVDTIHNKFLQNVARQSPPGFRLCLAVPAWKLRNGFKHLPTLDKLDKLGYTRQSFVHASQEALIYHREGQIVGRELVVLTRN